MTIRANRRVGVFLAVEFPVQALLVLLHLFSVTDRAVHLILDRRASSFDRGRDFTVTFGAGGLGVTGLRKLISVHIKRPAIRGRFNVRLAVTHQTVFVSDTLVIKYLSSLVWLMAFHADGDALRPFLPQFAFDHFPVHAFNLRVASKTGADDIFPCNRRARVRMR